MTDVPKCQSWMGHKFEPRYSTQPDATLAGFKADSVFSADLPKLLTKRTYEFDICVRCGHKVMK